MYKSIKEISSQSQDKNINITYELKILNERYNASIAKYEETKDEQYLKMAKSVLPNTIEYRKRPRQKRKASLLLQIDHIDGRKDRRSCKNYFEVHSNGIGNS